MKTKLNLLFSAIFLAAILFTACQKDLADEVDEPQKVTEETNYYTPRLTDFLTDRSGYWTEIPAGSVDVLNQAIADADDYGVIYLRGCLKNQ